MKHRDLRVGSLIKEELGKIILRELEFSGAIVTIGGVSVSDKLDRAEIKFSVLPFEKSAETLRILNGNRGRLRHLLLKKINIKPMPELVFKIDPGPKKAAEVEKLLME